MDGYQWLWVCFVAIATVTFLNYPPPPFSPRLKEWKKTGQMFKFKDYDIFYIVADGVQTDDSTVVLLHGFPTSSLDWSKILGGLQEQYSRVVMLDFLGFGFSDKPRYHKYQIMEQADIVEAVLVSLQIPEAHLISHDYGDTVALELLARHNSKQGQVTLKTLCMLNGGVFPETNFPAPVQRLLRIPYLGDILGHLTFRQLYMRSLSKVFGVHTQPTDEEYLDYFTLQSYKKGYLNTGRILHYISERNQHKSRWVGALQKSTIPVHMIYGPADPINPPVFVEHYKKVVPNPSIKVLGPDINHYPQVEDPNGVLLSYVDFIVKHPR